jgi:hypothetical protein
MLGRCVAIVAKRRRESAAQLLVLRQEEAAEQLKVGVMHAGPCLPETAWVNFAPPMMACLQYLCLPCRTLSWDQICCTRTALYGHLAGSKEFANAQGMQQLRDVWVQLPNSQSGHFNLEFSSLSGHAQ